MASSSREESAQEINVMSLSIPELAELKNQLEQIISLLQDSIKTLKVAQTQLSGSGDCLKKLTKNHEGAEILVPLSPFMYVPGRIADVNRIMIDIGTGYYVQKDMEGAIDYCKRKVNFITEQMEKVQNMALEKNRLRDDVVLAILDRNPPFT